MVEDLAVKLKKHLEEHEGIENLSKIYSPTIERYPDLSPEKIHDLLTSLKERQKFHFNYVTQNVSLKTEVTKNES